ncbi:MAG TPA: anti-sigma factor [Nitrospira sp.]|nr:anti-sigma factor [Nitrospira sp.]
MTHEELEEAVPLYAAGALDRAERQALEAHLLSGCASCHNALKDYQSVASLLPFGLSPVQAPRALKAKIMAARNPDAIAVDNGTKDSSRPSLEPGEWMNHLFPPIAPARSFSLPWVIGLAALFIVGFGGYLAWTYSARLSDDASKIQQLEASLQEQATRLAGLQRELGNRDRSLAELQSELQRRANEAAELKDQLLQREAEIETARLQLSKSGVKGRTPQDELATLLRQPNVKVVTLEGSGLARQSAAMLLYDARTQKAWLYFVNLPECPSGTTYQLWAFDQKPVSIGTFHMDAGQAAQLLVKRLPDFAKTKKFAVSLEPSGGRSQPTGPIYLTSQPS